VLSRRMIRASAWHVVEQRRICSKLPGSFISLRPTPAEDGLNPRCRTKRVAARSERTTRLQRWPSRFSEIACFRPAPNPAATKVVPCSPLSIGRERRSVLVTDTETDRLLIYEMLLVAQDHGKSAGPQTSVYHAGACSMLPWRAIGAAALSGTPRRVWPEGIG
jgi:hypothetical protein